MVIIVCRGAHTLGAIISRIPSADPRPQKVTQRVGGLMLGGLLTINCIELAFTICYQASSFFD